MMNAALTTVFMSALAVPDVIARRFTYSAKILIDPALDRSGFFAKAATQLGMEQIPFKGALCNCAAELDTQWAVKPFALLGVTTPSIFFVIEQFARRRGIQQIYLGHHLSSESIEWRSVTLASMTRAVGATWSTPQQIFALEMETLEPHINHFKTWVLA
jgi:hypothetical protein